ncbi:MAG TPA: ribosome silencing factor [Verrucomicrobiales bacterium]|nr:ribosome silencing factor [Verrucomicrobiales bacterium]HIL70302.1 ribosome silencing factor [Verrucomicrobiota bacterium]
MDSRELALVCRDLADNKKAENIVILDLRGISSIADYFVIASGSSDPHVRAIINEIRDKLIDDHLIKPMAVDGSTGGSWTVLDLVDVIVHVMSEDTRKKYNLEGLWGDAPEVKETRDHLSLETS